MSQASHRIQNYGQGTWDISGTLAPSTGVDPKVRELFLQEVKRVGDVPLLPPVAREVMALLRDQQSGMNQIAMVVRKDPAMAAHLLRIANSAAYVGTSPITSIRMALVRLGAEGMKRFLLSTSAARMLVVAKRPDLSARLQVRSVGVSNAAARVATHFGTDADAAFVGGLLHDVGWAIGYGLLHRLLPSLPPKFRDDEALVHGTIEALHTDIGAALAENWKLPPNAVDAIRGHHDPFDSGAGLMAYVVYAASHLCDSLGIGPVEPLVGNLVDDPVMRRLRIDQPAVDRILAGLKQDLGQK